jgi:lysozyme
LEAYLCPANIWTIGFGTTKINGIPVREGMKITQEEAENLLISDCQVFYNVVLGEIGKICNENQIAALISFCYNIGIVAFRQSTLLKVIKKNPNAKQIANEFMRWVFGGGKVLPGLVTRRGEERNVYFGLLLP